MLAWKEPEDSQYPLVASDVYESMWYASMWYTTKPMHEHDNRMLFFYISYGLTHVGNKPDTRLSPILYKQYKSITNFKDDFHRIYTLAHNEKMKTWHPLPYLVTDDDLLAKIKQWPKEWINTLETETKDSLAEKDTKQHGEASEKDKDEEEVEHEEQDEKGHKDPLGGNEHKKEPKNIETDPYVTEKRKVGTKASKRSKNKKKEDNTKDITSFILTDGDLDQIREIIQETMIESWNKLQGRYDVILSGVKDHNVELKIFAQIAKHPVQAKERLRE